MKPAIYRHRAAGWCLVMPGWDPIELPSWQAAVELLRQLDDRPPALTPPAFGWNLDLRPRPLALDEGARPATLDEAARPAVVLRRWRRRSAA